MLIYVNNILIINKITILYKQIRNVFRKFFELINLSEILKFLKYVIKKNKSNYKVFFI